MTDSAVHWFIDFPWKSKPETEKERRYSHSHYNCNNSHVQSWTFTAPLSWPELNCQLNNHKNHCQLAQAEKKREKSPKIKKRKPKRANNFRALKASQITLNSQDKLGVETFRVCASVCVCVWQTQLSHLARPLSSLAVAIKSQHLFSAKHSHCYSYL